ncbi:putative transcription factor SOX-14 [Hippoglossus stenolepis]|uniref:putative transcription factor SOX-14 n=1 Tax=Hippoglossus stenolepis TaxID=195615 RepID=UPI001FAEC76D|nr:putative transcription factor SOX-14 [Hippoglossus stenolepis]
MDFNAHVYGFVENTEIYDELEATWAIVREICGEMSDPTHPQAVPVDDWFYPLEGTTAEYTPLVATSLTLEQLLEDLRADLVAPLIYQQQSFLQPSPMHCQTQFDNQPTVTHTKHLEVKLRPIGVFDGKVIYGAPGDRVPPPVNVCIPQKRKRVIEEDDDTQYVKKPPNAFMLYRKEQRPKVLAELINSDCAAVNTFIGQMWKALSKKEQEKYYEEYRRLKRIHNQLYPDWSARDNYGKKRKRSPRKASAKTVNGVSPGSGRPPRFAPSWRNPRNMS